MPQPGSRERPRVPKRAPRLAILNEIALIASEDLELRSMLQRITDALAEMLGWELVALVGVEEDPRRFTCEALTTALPTSVRVGYGRELGDGVVGQVAATGTPQVVDDAAAFPGFVDTTPGVASELCVPILHRGKVVALLNAESTRPAAFRGQLRLAQEVAEQVAGAIASARLYEEVRRRAQSLEVLSEISRTALEGDDLDSLLQRIVEYVQQRFELVLVAIVVADESGTEWEHRAFAPRRLRGRIRRRRWPVEAGVVGRAIESGDSQLVLDVGRDPDYVGVADGVAAEFAVPILFRDRILGVLDFEAAAAAAFSSENLTLFRMLADQVAGAIQLALVNRRLLLTREEVEQANRRLQDANRALERLTRLDGLTGVANRRHFDETLEREWRRAARSGAPVALLLADIDCFKAFNDAYGHLDGDDCLRRVGQVLRAGAQRAEDLVARYGGEEFAVLLPGLDEEAAAAVAERLRQRLEELGIAHERSTVAPSVTLSGGVSALVPRRGLAPSALVAAADSALYRAKQAGRNRICRDDGEAPS